MRRVRLSHGEFTDSAGAALAINEPLSVAAAGLDQQGCCIPGRDVCRAQTDVEHVGKLWRLLPERCRIDQPIVDGSGRRALRKLLTDSRKILD